MGRIKTMLVKRVSNKLMEEKKDSFHKGDFDANKKVVNELLDIESKKIRNVIAGYITRLTKDKKKKTKKFQGAEKWKKTNKPEPRNKPRR